MINMLAEYNVRFAHTYVCMEVCMHAHLHSDWQHVHVCVCVCACLSVCVCVCDERSKILLDSIPSLVA